LTSFLKSRYYDQALLIVIYLFITFSLISIAGTHIALGLFVMLWLGQMVGQKKWQVRRTPLDRAFLFLVIAFILSTLFSPEPLASLRNLKNPLLILIVYALSSNLKTEKSIQHSITLFIVIATVVSAFGLVTTQIMAGKKVMGLQSSSMTWGAMGVIFASQTFSQALFGIRDRRRWGYLAAGIVQLLSLLFSYVRGAWLGFAAAVLLLLFLKNKKWILLTLVLAGAGFFVAPQPLQQRILNIANLQVGSTQVRLTQWRNSVKIFKDHPLTGVGWIDLAKIHKSYAPPGADLSYEAYWIGHFHSNYVMFLIYFGLIGVAALLYFLAKLFTSLWQRRRLTSADQPALSAWLVGTLAASLGFWINGLFDWTFGDAEVVSLWWLTLGLAFAINHLSSKSKEAV